jgi:malic enzyme
MGEMKRAIAYEERQAQLRDRFASTLVIAASIIAAVRLAREDIKESSPRLSGVVSDCVGLARIILNQIVR